MQIDYHHYARWAFPGMIGILLVLAALLVPGVGTSVYGAKAWIFVGPISFQPSEAAKLIMILYLATWFAGKGGKVRSASSGLAQFCVIMGLLIGLLMLEPDLGTATVFATIGVAMFFVAGAAPIQFVGLLIVGAIGFLTMALSASYRRDRLLLFLNPDSDLRNLGWQLYQARLALGSGGLFGVGLGASRQKFTWLPAAQHDAIFAVIGEELGLVGCVVVIGMFVLLGHRGYKIARRAPDAFGTLVAVGITTWIIFQAAFNIGGVTLAIPFTGIPLPFISAGGTSLAVAMTAVGVLLNISRQTLSDAELEPHMARVDAGMHEANEIDAPQRPERQRHPAPPRRRRPASHPQPTRAQQHMQENQQRTAQWRSDQETWT
jgi:cell division protein FtsW